MTTFKSRGIFKLYVLNPIYETWKEGGWYGWKAEQRRSDPEGEV